MRNFAFWLVYFSVGTGVASSEPLIRISDGNTTAFFIGASIWPGLVAARAYKMVFREALSKGIMENE